MAVSSSLIQLIDQELSDEQCRKELRSFAREYGWRPSDEIVNYGKTAELANGHLIVEHGLDNTAVISFLRTPINFTALSYAEQQALVTLSYNNLVDWHLFPDRGGILRVYNRAKPLRPQYVSLAESPNAHRADAFDQMTGRRPSPNLPAVDDALISTVAKWRRILAAELNLIENTQALADLFNGIFFVRALEDDQLKFGRSALPTLSESFSGETAGLTLRSAIRLSIERLTRQDAPNELVDFRALAVFDPLDRNTVIDLVSDFYRNRFAPYEYDFSLLSKHALSRIYEKYISLLRPSPSKQRVLFAGTEEATEHQRQGLGEIYTPQYIARFFSRFLHENVSPKEFRVLKALDPACGSGIFLRTLLEVQCDPIRGWDEPEQVRQSFENVNGIDIEENACKATKLSLSLLHLVLTGRFPTNNLKIEQANAIEWLSRQSPRPSFEAVIANPPFVRWEGIPEAWQDSIRELLGTEASGRPDLYFAFLKLACEVTSPGGFLLFVLPHAFLIADSAKPLRQKIATEFWIRHLVDLSKLNVFEDASSYPVLLIAQRKRAGTDEQPATITRCNSFAGQALETALSGREEATPFYDVYRVPQSTFSSNTWRTLRPHDFAISVRLSSLTELRTVFTVAQGINTGNDNVFILSKKMIPRGERRIFADLLRDRDMLRFAPPKDSDFAVFYPFKDGRLMEEEELREFTWTWNYLAARRTQLEARASVVKGDVPWWRPERPRQPGAMLRPKIVGPHLMLFPRFSFDVAGRCVVSRSPYVYHKEDDAQLLKLLLAFLNSSIGHWQIATQSHRYSRGYARLEAATLRDFRIPTPAAIAPRMAKAIVQLIDTLITGVHDLDAEKHLDQLVSEVYGIDASDLPESATAS